MKVALVVSLLQLPPGEQAELRQGNQIQAFVRKNAAHMTLEWQGLACTQTNPCTVQTSSGRTFSLQLAPGTDTREVAILGSPGVPLARLTVAQVKPQEKRPAAEMVQAVGWLLSLGLGTLLVRTPGKSTTQRAWLGMALGLLLVGFLWSWPAVLRPLDQLFVRQFDLFPAVWMAERAPQIGLDLHHRGSGGPVGESLFRPDSWIWLLLGGLHAPLLQTRLFSVLGPVLSAIAAAFAGKRLGLSLAGAVLAGGMYGFSGVMATAALEGQVYLLFNPFLPWIAASLFTPGQLRWPAAWGAAFGLLGAQWTSAYAGLAGLLVFCVGLSVRASELDWRGILRAGLCAGLVLGPALAHQVWLWRLSTGPERLGIQPEHFQLRGSLSLSELLWWSGEADTLRHSISGPLGPLMVLTLLLSPLVLRKPPPAMTRVGDGSRPTVWTLLWAGTLLAVALSMGPSLRWSTEGEGIPGPLRLLNLLPGAERIRFPWRFLFAGSLLGGLLAGKCLDTLWRRLSTDQAPSWILALGLVAVQAIAATGLPFRQGERGLSDAKDFAQIPQQSGILDLFGLPSPRGVEDADVRARALACLGQVSHGRPIPGTCIQTDPDDGRARWEAIVVGAALQDDGKPVTELGRRLQEEAGVGGVMAHLGWLSNDDQETLKVGLTRLFGAPVAEGSETEGPWVLYRIGSTSGLAAPEKMP